MEFTSDFFVTANNSDSFNNDVVHCLMSDFSYLCFVNSFMTEAVII